MKILLSWEWSRLISMFHYYPCKHLLQSYLKNPYKHCEWPKLSRAIGRAEVVPEWHALHCVFHGTISGQEGWARLIKNWPNWIAFSSGLEFGLHSVLRQCSSINKTLCVFYRWLYSPQYNFLLHLDSRKKTCLMTIISNTWMQKELNLGVLETLYNRTWRWFAWQDYRLVVFLNEVII